MNPVQDALNSAITEADKLRQAIKRGTGVQVKLVEERAIAKSTALAWFNNHRQVIAVGLGEQKLVPIDAFYNAILKCSEKNTTRNKYDEILKGLRKALVDFQGTNIVAIANAASASSSDKAPDFSTLVSDTEMRDILTRRWEECSICVHAKAPLAATVMMGGLLETLLLTRVHQFIDKPKIFNAISAPKDKGGKTLPLGEWTLRNYIDVAHELRWITQTEKDLGVVLRDYRNYIHPFKERSHGIKLEPNDSLILWELSKNISRQLLGLRVK